MRAFLALSLAVVLVLPLSADEDTQLDLAERIRNVQVTMEVEHATLGETLDLLRVQTGLNMLIDPRIASDVENIEVTNLIVEDLGLETVLNMLSDAAGEEVVWVIRDDVIVFTIREYHPLPLTVRIVPVDALVAPRYDLPPPPGLPVGPEPGAAEAGPLWPFGQIDELMELILAGVNPEFWEETEGVDIRALNETRLVVKASPEIHAGIDRLLARLLRMDPDTVHVEVRTVDAALLASVVDPNDSGAARLTDEQATALLAGEHAGPGMTLAVRKGLLSTAHEGSGATQGMTIRVRALPAGDDDRILLKLGVGLDGLSRESVLLLDPCTWHLAEGPEANAETGDRALLVRVTPVTFPHADTAAGTAFTVPTPSKTTVSSPVLRRRIRHLVWDDVGLDQIASYVRTMSGLSVYVAPRVRAEVFEEVQISLQLDDVPLEMLLDLVTEPYGLRWKLHDGVIVIAMADQRVADLQLRYFDMKDITAGLVAYEDVVGDAEAPTARLRPKPLVSEGGLVDLIHKTIGTRECWEDPAAIEARNRILIVRNTPDVLDAIGQLLTELRRSVEMIATSVDHVEVDAATAEALLGGRGKGSLLLEPAAVARLEKALAADDGSALALTRERVVSVAGSSAPRRSGKLVRIGLRAVPVHPGDAVYVEIAFDRNMPRESNVDSGTIRTGLRMPSGRTAVVGSSRLANGHWRLLLVTPRRVPLDTR